MEPQIGTILTEISPRTNLKHFIVYDTDGKAVWSTDGYFDAELVKISDNYFVIYSNGLYEAFTCFNVDDDTGMFDFEEVGYKKYISYYEIQEFEQNRMNKKEDAVNFVENSKTVTKEHTESLEEFKIQVTRKIKKMEDETKETITKYNNTIERLKTENEKLKEYKRMNNFGTLTDVYDDYKKAQNRIGNLEKKLGEQREIIGTWQEKAKQMESTITSLKGKISELQMTVSNYEKNNENIIEAMATEKSKDKVEKLKEVIAKKDEILKSFNKSLKIICAVNVFLLLLLAYAVTLIW